MDAVAQTPSFCNGIKGPQYAQFSDIGMCAKELASFLASYITSTLPAGSLASGYTMPTCGQVPCEFWQLGMATTEDPACSTKTTSGGANGNDMASDYCKGIGGDLSKIDKWFGFDQQKAYDVNND